MISKDNEFLGEMEFFPEDTDELFLNRIRQRVSQMLIEDSGLLFSYLYRMDIEEEVLKEILSKYQSYELVEALSQEIWRKQKERTILKSQIEVKPIQEKGWEF
ncbi:MAG: hypothetical protein HOP11_06720 [Saprospiraceae bacterium]|nr:hypothetical protein [Saprospiraceae bacterium]